MAKNMKYRFLFLVLPGLFSGGGLTAEVGRTNKKVTSYAIDHEDRVFGIITLRRVDS